MKYLVISHNEVDKVYALHGLKDTYEEAVTLAANHDWPDNPIDLGFTERDADKYFALGGVFQAQSGHDVYYIIPVEDRS